ncbi:MAG: T9SS type A sorting domain-containing protein [Saprospiraceae bacterium]|nr:T9SS type A sorting domain-containing protein [Saprospiraceae bacterium]
MNYKILIYFSCFILSILQGQGQNYNLEVSTQPYLELENPIILCKDSIGLRHYFTLAESMQVLGEEVDSFYIFNWANLHLALGKKKSTEADLFVPINTALRKIISTSDSIGFSISYEIKGEIGNRLIKVQWKDVKPKKTYKPNEVFNVQMIIDESDHSVSYHFGPMPEYFNTFFSLFLQSRILALYFIDNFKSFDAPRNEIYAIGQSIQDMSKLALTKNIIINGQFNDESYSAYLSYDHPNATLNSGQKFKITLLQTQTIDQISDKNNVIYPNPALDNLYFRNLNREFVEYEIMDRLGSIIKKGNIDNNFIDIKELSSGLYFLKLKSENELFEISRFIKL